jgi:hypothetical protein
MKRSIYRKLWFFLGITALCSTATAQLQPPATPTKPAEVPWLERTWQERAFKGTYEDFQTFKHKKTFDLDPFIWAYSQEFADKFRMPKAWIDPELKGAMAVAWRMTNIGQLACGLGGRAENCWPPLTCQMDIYFDSKTPLPWRYNDVVRDNFMLGVSSGDFLPVLNEESRRMRFARYGSKGHPLLNGTFNYVSSKTTTSGFFLTHFDRAYEAGVAVVGFSNTCPREGLDDAAVLKFFTQEEQTRTQGRIQNYAHEVGFSKTYMKKITDIYVVQNKPNQDITKRLIQDYFESRKGDPNFAPRQ